MPWPSLRLSGSAPILHGYRKRARSHYAMRKRRPTTAMGPPIKPSRIPIVSNSAAQFVHDVDSVGGPQRVRYDR